MQKARRVPAAQPLDQLGFLKDYQDWDEDFVHHIIKELKLPEEVTKRHLEILKDLREYFEKHRNIPTVNETCSVNNISLTDLKRLFPSGYRRGACRLAGLPFFA